MLRSVLKVLVSTTCPVPFLSVVLNPAWMLGCPSRTARCVLPGVLYGSICRDTRHT